MLGFARLFAVVVALFMIGGGLLIAIQADPAAPLFGLFLAAMGVLGIVVLFFERMRYQSAGAEESARAAREPGGDGPADVLEARFRPTDERFIDPSSGVPMRVYVDPETGERRYRRDDRI
jgi:hypothetical protein